MNNTLEEIAAALKENDRFLVASHVNPDGDALGSALALVYLLKKLGKEVRFICEDDIPYIYQFLNVEDIISKDEVDIEDWNVILVDCGEKKRAGRKFENKLKKSQLVLNIDHHPTNDYFGSLNYVDSTAAAAALLVWDLVKHMDIEIEKDLAESIYTGIFTDTGGFRHSNTDKRCFQAASELLGYGVDHFRIVTNIYQQNRPEVLLLLGLSLSNMQHAHNHEIVWTHIDEEMLEKAGCSLNDTEDTVNYLLSIQGVKVAAVFKEKEKNLIRVSLRSKFDLDVSSVAQIFDGGGHAKAAGCSVKSNMADAEKQVVRELVKLVEG